MTTRGNPNVRAPQMVSTGICIWNSGLFSEIRHGIEAGIRVGIQAGVHVSIQVQTKAWIQGRIQAGIHGGREAGIKVESIEELVDKLKNEAKVIS